MAIPIVKYYAATPNPMSEYAIEFALEALGYAARRASSPQDCHLYYGSGAARPAGVPVWIPEDADSSGLCPRAFDAPEADDVFRAIALLLTDRVNRDGPGGQYDEHDRLRFRASWQAVNGCAEIPFVNACVHTLREPLKRAVPGDPLGLWPEGKRAAIGLSHDVDRLDRWAEMKGCIMCLPRLGVAYMIDAARSLPRNLTRRHDDFGLFRDLMTFESELGFRSTFFFASVNRYEKGRDVHDVAYGITGRKQRRLFEQILSSGFEVGLHSSYRAREGGGDAFREERVLLERASGAKVLGQRHHFWHTDREAEKTIAHHEDAGFGYDSSIAFNEAAGFRRNVALPYYPWHPGRGRALRVLELPVFCMDGSVFDRRGGGADEAVVRVRHFAAIVKAHGGVGVINWHSDTSHPLTPAYRSWGACYFSVLETLADDSGIWVTNLGRLYQWVEERRARLRAGPLRDSCP